MVDISCGIIVITYMSNCKSLNYVLIVVLASFYGCSGPPVLMEMIADEEATMLFSSEHDFTICSFQHERFCQSADGVLVFHFPPEMTINGYDMNLLSDIEVSNFGPKTVVIDEYFITLVDDRQRLYRPRFSGPNEYNGDSGFSPALTLAPRAEAKIEFSTWLKPGTEAVTSVSIGYRLAGDDEFQRMVVSYRPGFILTPEN